MPKVRGSENEIRQHEQKHRLQVGGGKVRAELIPIEIRHERADDQPDGDDEHEDGVDGERGEKTAAEVFGRAKRRGEEERIHPHGAVA